ncbi:hypothetical protein [Halomonas sp. BC04]|uniref:hypothetical protein n=1 Tax=Halomonas sp. BC04 TaxID=1403540 RepID=UPI0005BAA023|nr:hypothetical protein [Halomonas sp. BC04]
MNQAWASRGSGAPARVPLGTSEVAIAEAVSTESAELADTGDETESPAEGAGLSSDVAAAVGETAEPRLTLLSDADLAAEAAASQVASADDEAGGEAAGTLTQDEAVQAGVESRIDPEVLAWLDADALIPQDEAQRLASLERRWLESQSASWRFRQNVMHCSWSWVTCAARSMQCVTSWPPWSPAVRAWTAPAGVAWCLRAGR